MNEIYVMFKEVWDSDEGRFYKTIIGYTKDMDIAKKWATSCNNCIETRFYEVVSEIAYD